MDGENMDFKEDRRFEVRHMERIPVLNDPILMDVRERRSMTMEEL